MMSKLHSRTSIRECRALFDSFFFSSRRRHTRCSRDWSSDVCSSDLYEGEATLSAEGVTRWYTNSDGSELQTSSVYYRLLLYAYTKAEDGMELPRYESFVAFKPENLPDDLAVLKAVDKMIADLHALKNAPIVEPYTGPAILSVS